MGQLGAATSAATSAARSAAESAPAPAGSGVPGGARVVVAFLAGRTAFGLAHLIGAARDVPMPWYQPLQRTFEFGPRPAGFAMEWYGRSLSSAVVAGVVTVAVWLLATRRPLAAALRSRGTVMALAQAAALALVVDFGYFAWLFLTQAVTPLPLPPGCAP